MLLRFHSMGNPIFSHHYSIENDSRRISCRHIYKVLFDKQPDLYLCLLNLNLSTTSWLLILLSSTLFILANAPVQNKHHKISETKLKKNKLYCRIYSLADLILFSLLLDSPLLHPYICLSIISVMLVALLILPTQMRKEE